ncbi:MAG: GNAT family N-acetyltransferase [Actinomycetota bacterium]|nr:GNAT family N-acetyltransferase [Actinomycetota bacterium]
MAAPSEPAIDVILKTGQSLRIRPITPEDKKRLEELFYRLSPWSRYLRFGYSKSFISQAELSYFTDIQPPDTYAFVATTGEAREERIVAVGRWFLLPDGETAEVAFVVEDNIQIRGIGTALLEQLAQAAARYRIRRFVARVLPENTRMIEVFDESGFRVVKRIEEGAFHISIDLREQEEFSKRQEHREHIARSAGVKKMLYPLSVAVIGASRDPGSVGGAIFRNLIRGSFTGTIFPVNPRAVSIGGVLAYPSVLDVPGDVDLAIIAVPSAAVLDVADECGRKGIWGLVIISAGFGEAGPAGKEREKKLIEKALGYGMRVIGPNCLGILNASPKVNLNATFSPVSPVSGSMGICSQSGALGLALLEYSRSMSLGISSFVSIGNRVDISSNDLLEFWEDDEDTAMVILYLESFGNPRKFSRIARRVSHKKPVIAVKGGKSEAGAKAAVSHTGALAAAEVAVEAMFRQTGIIRVDTIEEMFNVAKFLSEQPLPKGPGVGILTNAGGPGVLAADACIGWGLTVPALSDHTKRKLQDFLPAEAALSNPVDMIASAPAAAYEQAINVMLDDPHLDALIVIYIPPLVTRPEDVAAAIRSALGSYDGDKPVSACFMTTAGKVDLELENKKRVPAYIFPEDGVQALARAYRYSLFRQAPTGVVPKFDDINEAAAAKIIYSAATGAEAAWLLPEDCVQVLGSFGIKSIRTEAAMNAAEAAAKAVQVGFPAAIKLRSSSLTHKTDIGGVILDVGSEAEAVKAFESISGQMTQAGLDRDMQGVIVQQMAFGGQEVIVGMTQDPTFGPLVMVGLGGIQVELMKDVSFSLHPLTDLDPARMLGRLKSLPLLKGWRGRQKRDIKALEELLLRFSALIEAFPDIEQMEINPVLVLDEGKGCVCVDSRIRVRPA